MFTFYFRFKLRYILRCACAVALIVLMLGSISNQSQAQGDGYGCLRFMDSIPLKDDDFNYRDNDIPRGIFNLDTGVYNLPSLSSDEAGIRYELISPDKLHVAYFQQTENGYTLKVRSADAISPDAGEKIRDGLAYLDFPTSSAMLVAKPLLWSPDTRWIAYRWEDDSHQQFIAVAGVDGRERQFKRIAVHENEVAILHDWSGDSKYLSIIISGKGGNKITFWTAPDLTLLNPCVLEESPTNNCKALFQLGHYDSVAWWHENQIAYIVSDAVNTPYLIIWLLDQNKHLTFHVPSAFDSRMLEWSPDGRWIAVMSGLYVAGGTLRLDVFGLDGTVVPRITSGLANVGYANLLFRWSPDGKYVYHVEAYPEILPPDHPAEITVRTFHRLIVFNLDKRLSRTLVSILAEHYRDEYSGEKPAYTNDGKYVLVDWSQDQQIYIGIFNTITGTHTILLQKMPTDAEGDYSYHIYHQWSPGEKIATASWDKGFAWSYADGSHFHTISFPRYVIEWSKDEQWMVLGNENDEYNFWLVNIDTGDIRPYSVNNIPRHSLFNRTKVHISPDDHTFVVIDTQTPTESGKIHFMSLNGDWSRDVVVEGLQAVKQILWSADGSLLVLTFKTATGSGLALMRTDGTLLRHFDDFPLDLPVIWVDCH